MIYEDLESQNDNIHEIKTPQNTQKNVMDNNEYHFDE